MPHGKYSFNKLNTELGDAIMFQTLVVKLWLCIVIIFWSIIIEFSFACFPRSIVQKIRICLNELALTKLPTYSNEKDFLKIVFYLFFNWRIVLVIWSNLCSFSLIFPIRQSTSNFFEWYVNLPKVGSSYVLLGPK